MTNEELYEILEKHRKWLNDEEGGERADLKDADLRNANLIDADLSYADLRNANLIDAYLSYADLRSTDLINADLIRSDLVYTKLNNADLSYADLMYADLRNANLKNTNLTNANLTGVISSGISNKRIIAVQVNTSRENNLISYWYDLGIVTTGCFQGTLDELKERVEITHEDNDTLRNRYHRAIQFIEDTIKDYDEELERIENEKEK